MMRKGYLVFLMVFILFFSARAMAGGGQNAPQGLGSFLNGVLPPPGLLAVEYLTYYTADKLKDNKGNTIKLNTHGAELDHLNVFAASTRLAYITPFKVLGGNYAFQVVVPAASVDTKMEVMTPAGPMTSHKREGGLPALIFTPFFVGWHSKSGLLHSIFNVDLIAPVGHLAKDYWTFEMAWVVTAFFPPDPNLAFDLRLMYDVSTPDRNVTLDPGTAMKIGSPGLTGLKTHLTPGQEFHCDYFIEYSVARDWRVGVGGYFYQQTTDDRTGPGSVKNDKGRVFAIGPGVWYTYKTWAFDLHTAFETGARNRPQGINTVLAIAHKF